MTGHSDPSLTGETLHAVLTKDVQTERVNRLVGRLSAHQEWKGRRCGQEQARKGGSWKTTSSIYNEGGVFLS
jgi:hypothetical protein